MKFFKGIKIAALGALVLSIAVGCASTPEPEVGEDQAVVAQRAIDDARAANERAKAAGAEWMDTEEMIKEAEAALAAGDTGRAIQLANDARRQAEERLAAMSRVESAPASDTYTVVAGDTLWGISARSEIYGNPYQWPLIFKANRSQINDADLIFPGQDLEILRDISASDVDAAVNHARTRGAWSLGVVEASDEAYLAR